MSSSKSLFLILYTYLKTLEDTFLTLYSHLEALNVTSDLLFSACMWLNSKCCLGSSHICRWGLSSRFPALCELLKGMSVKPLMTQPMHINTHSRSELSKVLTHFFFFFFYQIQTHFYHYPKYKCYTVGIIFICSYHIV